MWVFRILLSPTRHFCVAYVAFSQNNNRFRQTKPTGGTSGQNVASRRGFPMGLPSVCLLRLFDAACHVGLPGTAWWSGVLCYACVRALSCQVRYRGGGVVSWQICTCCFASSSRLRWVCLMGHSDAWIASEQWHPVKIAVLIPMRRPYPAFPYPSRHPFQIAIRFPCQNGWQGA